MIAADDRHFCVILGNACWLEYCIGLNWDLNSDFVYAIDNLGNQETIKKKAADALSKILKDEDLVRLMEEQDACDADELQKKKTGSHSIRKCACTYARQNGCRPDYVDYRFRWKKTKQQDTYVEGSIPVSFITTFVFFAVCVIA